MSYGAVLSAAFNKVQGKKASRQTSRPASRQARRKVGNQASKQAGKQVLGQTSKQAGRQASTWMAFSQSHAAIEGLFIICNCKNY